MEFLELDPWVSCPYNKVHRVPQSRLQAHIVKCEKHHPPLQICPYNATHRMSEEELKKHVHNCPSKASMFPEAKLPKIMGRLNTPRPMLQKEYLPETDPNHETWDK